MEQLLAEELVLVERVGKTTASRARAKQPPGYVHVDWGPEFFAKHQNHFPELHPPALVVDIGSLGLEHILREGGAGYFPERLLRGHLSAGDLRRVRNTPTFTLPAYAVYPEDREADDVDLALDGIPELAATVRSG